MSEMFFFFLTNLGITIEPTNSPKSTYQNPYVVGNFTGIVGGFDITNENLHMIFVRQTCTFLQILFKILIKKYVDLKTHKVCKLVCSCNV